MGFKKYIYIALIIVWFKLTNHPSPLKKTKQMQYKSSWKTENKIILWILFFLFLNLKLDNVFKLYLFSLGKEFVAEVIRDLARQWPGLVIVNGRPRHPQSQGCIERANGDLQKKLGKLMDQLSCNWASALNLTIYGMNTTVSTVTGMSVQPHSTIMVSIKLLTLKDLYILMKWKEYKTTCYVHVFPRLPAILLNFRYLFHFLSKHICVTHV